jgi:hypothetical protein
MRVHVCQCVSKHAAAQGQEHTVCCNSSSQHWRKRWHMPEQGMPVCIVLGHMVHS